MLEELREGTFSYEIYVTTFFMTNTWITVLKHITNCNIE